MVPPAILPLLPVPRRVYHEHMLVLQPEKETRGTQLHPPQSCQLITERGMYHNCWKLLISRGRFLLSVQFSSVAQSCPTLCDPMNRSMPGFPVYHQLPESTQTHVHRVGLKTWQTQFYTCKTEILKITFHFIPFQLDFD